jgi:hypothetical protein
VAADQVEGVRGESGIQRGGGSSTLSPGGHAIEGTSCGLGAKLEGAAIGAYAEKYRFLPGCSVGPWRIGKTPWRVSQ